MTTEQNMSELNVNHCIMFPNNSTSVFLGQTLVSDLGNVAYFIPEGTHEQAAFTCYEEVFIAAAGIQVSVAKKDDYKELESFAFIIFPSLDVDHHKSRKEFGIMCKNLFK